jgi:hypothetical protein
MTTLTTCVRFVCLFFSVLFGDDTIFDKPTVFVVCFVVVDQKTMVREIYAGVNPVPPYALEIFAEALMIQIEDGYKPTRKHFDVLAPRYPPLQQFTQCVNRAILVLQAMINRDSELSEA